MSVSNNQKIAAILGLAPAPEGLLAWHLRICEGFPASCIKALAASLGVNAKSLTNVVGAPAAKQALSAEASNTLFRIAAVWVELQGAFAKPADASVWLTTAAPALRGRVPLALLTSTIGYDYVRAAVERVAAAR